MIQEIHQELKGSSTMVHANVETRSLTCNSGILKDVTRDFTSTEIDLAKEIEKDKHDRKKPLEA